MKTQVIHLEPHDDIVSVRDKMGWCQAGRVLLVWPARDKILTRQLDLILLLRQSSALGLQLALICHDREVRDHATSLGISVFHDIQQAQGARWMRPKRKHPSYSAQMQDGSVPLSRSRLATLPRPVQPSSELKGHQRIALFSLGVLAVLAIAGVLFPGAEVRLEPRSERQVITFNLLASRSAQRVNLPGVVPLRTITRVVEGRSSLPATGEVLLPENPAQGEVVFTNLTDRPVEIPTGTIVGDRKDKIRFVTLREGRVPAGPGTNIKIAVQAVLPGSSGNLPPGTIQAIEGELGVALAVNNPTPTTGGTDASSPAPSEDDRSQLYSTLLTTLNNTAYQEMRRALDEGDILVSPSAELIQVFEEKYEPPLGEPGNLLTLKLRAEFIADYIALADILDLARGILDANLPENYTPSPNDIKIEQIERVPSTAAGEYRWRVQASRKILYQPEEDQVIPLILGRTPAKARERLKDAFSLPRDPEITLSPTWWPMMPILPFRISLIAAEHSS